MPHGGILAVTVPGTVWGWDAALRRFGSLSFKEVLETAARYAQNGFPVSERIASDWRLPNALPLRGCCTQPDPDSVKVWYLNGQPPKPGQIFRNPDLGRTFRVLQSQGVDAFYKGEIARAIIAKSKALGGTMTMEDLADYRGEWVEPARTQYHGYEVLELPPPSQAWATDEMLNILAACLPKWAPGQTLAELPRRNPRYAPFLTGAKNPLFAAFFQSTAAPYLVTLPPAQLLSSALAASLCAKFAPRHASVTGTPSGADLSGDTIVLSTAD